MGKTIAAKMGTLIVAAMVVVSTAAFGEPHKTTLQALDTAQSATDGYRPVSFSQLSTFTYTPPDLGSKYLNVEKVILPIEDRTPDAIKKLHQQNIVVNGFFIPMEIDNGIMKSFLLTKGQLGCCFGVSPKLNDWILVESNIPYTEDYIANEPMTVYGRFEVGESIEHGEIISLFRLKAARVDLDPQTATDSNSDQ